MGFPYTVDIKSDLSVTINVSNFRSIMVLALCYMLTKRGKICLVQNSIRRYCSIEMSLSLNKVTTDKCKLTITGKYHSPSF